MAAKPSVIATTYKGTRRWWTGTRFVTNAARAKVYASRGEAEEVRNRVGRASTYPQWFRTITNVTDPPSS